LRPLSYYIIPRRCCYFIELRTVQLSKRDTVGRKMLLISEKVEDTQRQYVECKRQERERESAWQLRAIKKKKGNYKPIVTRYYSQSRK